MEKLLIKSSELIKRNFVCGAASIVFREKKENEPDSTRFPFVLNGKDDGWFRINDSISFSDGYGLCINEIKLTGKMKPWGNYYNVIKAKMNFISNWGEGPEETAPIFLIVHVDCSEYDVLAYIEKNFMQWEA